MNFAELTHVSLGELVHIHLLLNHFPTVGFIVGLGLFAIALVVKSDDLKQASLGVFLVIALLALPAYMTGKAAQEAIAGQPGVSDVMIETHQDAALLSLVFMLITGALSWLGLWQYRRIARAPSWNISAILFFSVVTFALMARTANLGGEIRHPEILQGQGATAEAQPPTADTEWLQAASLGTYISSKAWAWPAMETLHFVGLCLLFGAVLVVNLRMLGVMKSVPLSALHRLLPWGILGFAINVVTGVLFFVTVPGQYTQNIALQWKTVLMMIAGMNVFYYTMFDEVWAIGPGDDAPLTGKVIAVSTIFLWLGVILLGRFMPFIGGSF